MRNLLAVLFLAVITLVANNANAGSSSLGFGQDAVFEIARVETMEGANNKVEVYFLCVAVPGDEWCSNAHVKEGEMKLLLEYYGISDYRDLKGKKFFMNPRDAFDLMMSDLKKGR